MASGDVKMAVLGNIHMYIRVIEVSDFKSDFKFLLLSSLPCIVARSSKGPLPSGSVILFSHFPLFRKQRLRELLAFFPASTCAASNTASPPARRGGGRSLLDPYINQVCDCQLSTNSNMEHGTVKFSMKCSFNFSQC